MGTQPSRGEVEKFFRAIEEGDASTVRAMLEKGMSPNAYSEQCPAIYAAAEADSAEVLQLLIEFGADPDQRHGSKLPDCPVSALNMASYKANLTAVDLLLDAGADPKLLSNDARTAAHYLLTDHRAMETPPEADQIIKRLSRLLDKGIPVNARDDYKMSLLHQCAHSRQCTSVAVFLLERGVNPHLITSNGDQAIHLAARRATADTVRLLLACGVNVDTPTASGKTALFVSEGFELGPLLLDAGANINHQDDRGDTALHSRLRSSYDYMENEYVLFLISAGANILVRNKKGELPQDLVERRNLGWCEPVLAAASARQLMKTRVTEGRAARTQRP